MIYLRVIFFIPLCFSSHYLLSAPLILEQKQPLLYAVEVIENQKLGANGALTIDASADELNLSFNAGFGISSSERYIRLDLLNGRFNQNFPASGIKVDADYNSTLVVGGRNTDTYMIVEVKASVAQGAETSFILESNSFIWLDYRQALSVQYTYYASAAAAVNSGDFLYQITAPVAQSMQTIGTSFTRSFSHTIELSQDFKKFKTTYRNPSSFSLGDANADLASLGKVQFDSLITQPVRHPSTSALITVFSDLLPTINTAAKTATINGDFSTLKAFLNTQDDCLGTSHELAEFRQQKWINVSINELMTYPVFCVAAESKTLSINRSSYYLDLGIGLETSLLGELIYDAAAVDLPYVTNFSDYRQRIILVNHAGYDVKYTTRFMSELEVAGEYTLGDYASGIIPAGATLKLNAEDLVNINKGVPSRVSARIYIDASSKDIAAAVQILSLGSNLPPITNVLQVIEY